MEYLENCPMETNQQSNQVPDRENPANLAVTPFSSPISQNILAFGLSCAAGVVSTLAAFCGGFGLRHILSKSSGEVQK